MMIDLNSSASFTGPPSILDHDLNQYFPELLKFESTRSMEASDLYRQIRPEIERVLNAVVVETFVVDESGAQANWPPAHAGGSDISALAWNLERGIRLDGIIDALKNNAWLNNKDVLLLTELDYGMARSSNRFVAREIARELDLNYAFAPVYIPLQKGSGVEAEMAGENTVSIHGVAMMSPWPMKNVHAVTLPNGKDKMWGKEKRLGYLRAIVADIEHPTGEFRAVTVHLDAHCSRAHRRMNRCRSFSIILIPCRRCRRLIGGDWNTTTLQRSNAQRGQFSATCRRVMMGVKNVAENHLPHPDRYFERRIFAEIESRGFDYRSLNEIGVGTLHYHIRKYRKEHEPSGLGAGMVLAIYLLGRPPRGRSVFRRGSTGLPGRALLLSPGNTPQTVGGSCRRRWLTVIRSRRYHFGLCHPKTLRFSHYGSIILPDAQL